MSKVELDGTAKGKLVHKNDPNEKRRGLQV